MRNADVANDCSLPHADHQFGVDPDCCTVHWNSTKLTKELHPQISGGDLRNTSKGVIDLYREMSKSEG
jgi:hypothetical protein